MGPVNEVWSCLKCTQSCFAAKIRKETMPGHCRSPACFLHCIHQSDTALALLCALLFGTDCNGGAAQGEVSRFIPLVHPQRPALNPFTPRGPHTIQGSPGKRLYTGKLQPGTGERTDGHKGVAHTPSGKGGIREHHIALQSERTCCSARCAWLMGPPHTHTLATPRWAAGVVSRREAVWWVWDPPLQSVMP